MDLGTDLFCLFLHLVHQPGALDHILVTGIIFDIRGDHQLSAGLQSRNQHGFQIGARGIDCGRVSGRSGTDDQDFGVMLLGHGASSIGLLVAREL